MAINTLATATLFMTQLDKIAVQEATTGWMDANAGQVIYNGGSEVKIPKMSVQGMGDYDREAGYQRGSVTLEYETRKMTQDRGRLFQLDPMDINEANFIPTAGAVMGEFQRTQVVPEIDAYRISKLATETLTADKAGMIGESYVPGATGTSALRKFKEGIKAVRDSYNGALICQATPEFIMELELELAGKIENTTFSKGGIDTRVPAVDRVPLIPTSSNRMYTAIKINDGKTVGQEKGGWGTDRLKRHYDVSRKNCPRRIQAEGRWPEFVKKTAAYMKGATTVKNTTTKNTVTLSDKIEVQFPVIQKGSKGTAVSMLQAVLGVKVDGDFGNDTETSLKAFQKNVKLTADGICGKDTWTKVIEHMKANT